MPNPHRYPKALGVSLACFIFDVGRLHNEMQNIKERLNGIPLAASLRSMEEVKHDITLIKNIKLISIQSTATILENSLIREIERQKQQPSK
jgi:uncharacterized Fe-S cluster-containing radical SAM superfamily enzyme